MTIIPGKAKGRTGLSAIRIFLRGRIGGGGGGGSGGGSSGGGGHGGGDEDDDDDDDALGHWWRYTLTGRHAGLHCYCWLGRVSRSVVCRATPIYLYTLYLTISLLPALVYALLCLLSTVQPTSLTSGPRCYLLLTFLLLTSYMTILSLPHTPFTYRLYVSRPHIQARRAALTCLALDASIQDAKEDAERDGIKYIKL